MKDVMPMCKGCEKLFSLLTAERAEHANRIFELRALVSQCGTEPHIAALKKQIADLNGKLKAWDAWYALFGDMDLETQVINLREEMADLHQQIYEIKKVYNALSGPRAHQLGCDCGGKNRSGYTCKQFYDLMKKD